MQSTSGERAIAGGFIVSGPKKWLVGRAIIAITSNGSEVHTLLSAVKMDQLLVGLVVVLVELSHGLYRSGENCS